MLFTNSSSLQFVLLGFSDVPKVCQIYLLVVFFTMYLVTLIGNVIILSCIIYDPTLHSPMYFFLSNLSLVDIGFTSSTIPTLLSTLLLDSRSLGLPSCISQMFCFISFGNLENNLLAVMAYDRYVAICSPLRYSVRMGHGFCVFLVAMSWAAACSHALLHTLMVITLQFNGKKQVNHFFCEISKILAISESDTTANFSLILTEGAVSVGVPFLCIMLSYILILVALFRLHFTQGSHKTFSTCSSHLTTVCLFYGTIVSVYFRPTSTGDKTVGIGERVATIGYTLLTPMLNPIIYGLRNKAIKRAMTKVFGKI